LPGELIDPLADHTGTEPDWRIVFYHVDHLGTPRVLTDEYGAVISKHALFPFGEEVAPASPEWAIANSTNTHWFTGHERDAGGWKDYMLARSYSNSTARFQSPDRLRGDLYKPGSGALYTYVWNRPLVAVDPDGEAGCFVDRELGSPEGPATPQGFFRHRMSAVFDPAGTDEHPNGTVQHVSSWNNGTTTVDDPDDLAVAQEAIDNGFHEIVTPDSLDSFVYATMLEARDNPGHPSHHRWGPKGTCKREAYLQ